MKRIKKIIIVLLITLLLTGCAKLDIDMNIKRDGSMTYKIDYSVSKDVLNGQDLFDENEIKNLKEKKYDINKTDKDGFISYSLTKNISDINEVSSNNEIIYILSDITTDKEDEIFYVQNGLLKDKYKAVIKLRLLDKKNNNGIENTNIDSIQTPVGSNSTETSNETVKEVVADNSFDISFKVNLPRSAISNNATKTEKNNKVLIWSYNSDSSPDETIEFEFELYNKNMMYILASMFVFLMILVIILNRRK